jgi:hypothetical protein
MSKFGDLRDAKNRAAEPAALAVPSMAPSPSPALPKPLGPGSRGGKRADPAFSQATTYLPSVLLHKVKGRLHEERGPGGKGRDLSDLVAELLTEWLGNSRV